MGKSPSPSPIAQAPVAEPAPPVTTTSAEVLQANSDLRRQEMLKKSIRSTIKAGDTGGFSINGPKPMGGAMPKPAGGNPFVAPQGKF